MPDQYLAATAPVFAVDGQVKGELARDLLRLEVEEDTDGLRTLTARLLAAGGAADPAAGRVNYLDGAVLDFGKRLRVSIGPVGTERIIFDGFVSALEVEFAEGEPPDVRVRAEDALMKLRMTRRSKTYSDVSDADIARSIASDHGLSAEVDADGPTYRVVQQLNQSDLAFLRDRARGIQAEIWASGDALHLATRQTRTATAVTLVQGNHLLAVQLRADLAHQRTEVRMSGYDAGRREPIDERAGDDVVQAEVVAGPRGPAVLRSALGERTAHLAREVPVTGGEASAWARAEMLRRARSFVSVTGLTSGTPDLVVGSRVRLERVGGPFEGDGYYVTRVRHTYDWDDGHRTAFDAERPTLGAGVAA